MTIPTRQSLTGFIASNPQLSFTAQGDARLYAKVGCEHHRRLDDGTFEQLETTFHDLVIYRTSAERAHELLAKGDRVVAHGYVRDYEHTVDGQTRQAEEFVARRIGHDLARTTYTVDRTPRRTAPSTSAVDRPTLAARGDVPSH